MFETSLAGISWLVGPWIGDWPLVLIWGLILAGLIYYWRRQPDKVWLMMIIFWLPWLALLLIHQTLLLKDNLAANDNSKLAARFCYVNGIKDDYFCWLGKLINNSRALIPSGSKVFLKINPGTEPYFYYFFANLS